VPIAGLCGLAFLILASYGLARPGVESLFLAEWSSRGLPLAWMAVAVVATAVVSLYNRFVGRVGLVTLLGRAALASGGVLALLLIAHRIRLPGASFALYVWKDVYIVVLIEVFWSYANAAFPVRTARWIYGGFCVAGSLGGICANLAIGALAARFTTAGAVLFVLPVLGLTWLGAALFRRLPSTRDEPAAGSERPSPGAGFAVLRRSGYLKRMLALIALVQVVITLIDYQYNVMVEAAYPDADARTAVIGQIYATINAGSLGLQAGTAFVLRYVGVPATLLGIPLLLGAAVGAFAIAPRFAAMAVAKVASKCMDYSIFRAAKEILYIPLGYAEKTQGKALVDMLTYRVAKGGASLLLLGLTALAAGAWVSWVSLGFIGAWIAVTVGLVRAWRARTAATERG